MTHARLFSLSALCLLLAATLPCRAQSVDTREDTSSLAQGDAMPAWVVPVLRLVSSTHVEPTTGVVISDTGLVLVPAGFATAEDEIIVLDGGTDIVRHGRTARLEREFFTQGLQVLRVSGLQRTAAPFTDGPLSDGSEIRLTAFPPAEQIAEGAAPLNRAATLVVFGENATPAIAGETALPNVSGALLDHCGNLAGYSMAHDVQSMDTHPGTRYKWRPALLDVLRALRITPVAGACPAAAETEPAPASEPPEPQPEEPAAEEETPAPKPIEEPPAKEPSEEADPMNAAEEAAAEEPDTEAVDLEAEKAPPEEMLDLETLPPFESGDEEASPPEEPSGLPAWPWLLLAALLFAGGIALHLGRSRLRESGRQSGDDEADDTIAPPAAEEDEPGFDAPRLDSRLVLRGAFADGEAIDLACPVSRSAINVVIGRGQAELRLDSLAVSRQHAALNGAAGALTLTDLGSNNGSTINGVPCLEGEIMYVEAGDTIILGNARFTFDIEPTEPGDDSP